MQNGLLIISIILATGLILCFLATIGYNLYVSVSKEKVEVKSNKNDFNN